MSEPAGAAPTCPRHPDRVSYVRCQRCGRPVCPECQRPAPVGIQCVDCVAEAARARGPVRSRLGFVPQAGPTYVTYALIGLNVAAYLYGLAIGEARWAVDWGLWPGLSDGLFGLGTEWQRWLTSGFLHFSWWHIGMNTFVLWQFGTQLEPALGRLRFVGLYLASLLGSSLAVVLLGEPGSVHGGASGAIFGIFAAYAIVLRRLGLQWQQVATTAGLWLALGFVVPGLSWQGHLGGAVTGALVMLAMFRGVDRRESRPRARQG